MRVMQVDASPKRAHSSSKMLSAYFIERLRKSMPDIDVDYMDTSIEAPPHLTPAFIEAMYTPATDRSLAMKQVLSYSDKLCARALMADMLVCAMPMYNFCMPSSFKAFIDHLVRLNLTYTLNADGTTTGNLSRQKILFITTRGADLRPGSPWQKMDALRPALTAAFSFMGADDPVFVDVQPLESHDAVLKATVLDQARLSLDSIAQRWLADI
ncbi:MAG: FMN-dependent NADH-azoreductase [Methylophilus sp.]|uniref:FMN-dependent NADH-azoreductase n=1 Tax=Methylophilus sp. TaxID=29541 RepID=UPI003FA031C7